jgi:hypothetical protein
MDQTEERKDEDRLWRFIPLNQFSKPDMPAGSTVRIGAVRIWESIKNAPPVKGYLIDGISRFWQGLAGNPKKPEQFIPWNALRIPTSDLLARIAPDPDWSEAALAMGEMVDEWLEEEESLSRLRIVLNVPFSGTNEAMTLLAAEKNWPVLEPPSPEEILEGGSDWLKAIVKREGSPLVIPALERCYLRHYNGLTLLRKLVDWLLSHNRPCLIGCNSWAWTYLNSALSLGRLFPEPYIPRPFDGKHLQHWFRELVGRSDAPGFVFRQADNGKLVLLSDDKDAAYGTDHPRRAEDSGDVSDFLKDLSAYTRGIPGIALAFWRKSLRLASKEEVEERAREVAENDHRKTIWVKPWSRLDLPTMPADRSRSQLFVLHTILLHDNLEPNLLRKLLSISTIDILETLHQLRKEGLLEAELEEAVWRIAPAGYPAIRHELDRSGYLVDAI